LVWFVRFNDAGTGWAFAERLERLQAQLGLSGDVRGVIGCILIILSILSLLTSPDREEEGRVHAWGKAIVPDPFGVASSHDLRLAAGQQAEGV
jgi:hypothetical protein